jgi:hypothetical protein
MSPPSSIAHYKITAKVGEGSMGEVWRATDTKLGLTLKKGETGMPLAHWETIFATALVFTGE